MAVWQQTMALAGVSRRRDGATIRGPRSATAMLRVLVALGLAGLPPIALPAQAQSAGPQGGYGANGPNGTGGAGGGPGMNGQPGNGPGGGAGGTAGSNMTPGATGTNGGGSGSLGTNGSGGGGGGGPAVSPTMTTLDNPAGRTLTGSMGFTFMGTGTASGGAGGYGAVVSTGGGTNGGTIDGGAGSNPSSIFGGPYSAGSGGGGGGGVLFQGSNIVFDNNGGTISGGTQPTTAVGATGGTATTTVNGPAGGTGGAGVEFAGSTTTLNTSGGTITGATGGAGGQGAFNSTAGDTAGAGGVGGSGGAGVMFDLSNGRLDNAGGTITGGTGGQGAFGGSNVNASGGVGGSSGVGGTGGSGVAFAGSNGTLVNSGTITGGAGARSFQGGAGFGSGAAAAGTGGTGGAGGNGGIGALFVGSGNALSNIGTISGGNGAPGAQGGLGAGRVAASTGAPGVGGIGIVASGITIANAGGTIAGGMSGDTMPVQAYAIELTGGTNSVGTGGTITGGMNIIGGASFQPALPGSAVGTPLAVGGPIAFAPGTFYNVRITPTATDSVVATGGATLTGATVNVAAGTGTYQARRYTILTAAGGLGGTTFTGVTSNLAFLMPRLSYDADDVYLTISGGGSYVIPGLTQNQYAVASGLTNAARANGGTGPILGAFNQLSVPQAQAAFDSISGEGIAAAQNSAFGSTALFISSIFDQTTFYGGDGGSANQITLTAPQPGFSAYAPSDGSFTRTPIHELADLPSTRAPIPAPVFVPQRTWRAWATGFGGVEDFSGNAFPVGSAGQSDTIYGGTLGIDYQLMPNYLAGLAIGGSNGDFSVPGRATSGSTTGGHVAFYDLATFGAFYAASTTSASFYSNQTTRTIAGFGGLGGETDRGNFRSNAYSSKVEFGRHFAAYGGVITPFASIELTDLRSYGFTETPLSGPGLFALNVQGQDTASVPSLVGARFQTLLPLGNGLVLSPSLQLAWEHQFSPQRPVLAGLVNLPGAVFLTNGASPARDSAAVKAGGELAITKQAALFANFDGDFSGVDRFYGGKGGFKYVW